MFRRLAVPVHARRKVAARLFVVLVTFVGISGCDSGPERLDAEEFTERANAACDSANSDLDEMLSVGVSDPQAAADDLDDVTERQRGLVVELRGLRPPTESSDTHDRFLAAVSDALDANAAIAESLRSDDAVARLEAIEAANAASSAADQAALELDLTSCASLQP